MSEDLPSSLADALAQLASGVSLIALWEGDQPRGLLVTSLIGLSVAPPRLLFTARREASAHAALMAQDRCAATILAAEDRADALLFAASRPSEERFGRGGWDLAEPHAPRFLGGVAQFVLTIDQRIAAESHTIFIAAVESVTVRPGASPLVYHDRAMIDLAGPRILAA